MTRLFSLAPQHLQDLRVGHRAHAEVVNQRVLQLLLDADVSWKYQKRETLRFEYKHTVSIMCF